MTWESGRGLRRSLEQVCRQRRLQTSTSCVLHVNNSVGLDLYIDWGVSAKSEHAIDRHTSGGSTAVPVDGELDVQVPPRALRPGQGRHGRPVDRGRQAGVGVDVALRRYERVVHGNARRVRRRQRCRRPERLPVTVRRERACQGTAASLRRDTNRLNRSAPGCERCRVLVVRRGIAGDMWPGWNLGDMAAGERSCGGGRSRPRCRRVIDRPSTSVLQRDIRDRRQ